MVLQSHLFSDGPYVYSVLFSIRMFYRKEPLLRVAEDGHDDVLSLLMNMWYSSSVMFGGGM